ncbi:MAG: prolyl oligopeptidase family serine peptidase, partial [Oscillochloris sp.]|nr:prolyl oligopeptidase family serine peptidase [Oscillochloris sp.]
SSATSCASSTWPPASRAACARRRAAATSSPIRSGHRITTQQALVDNANFGQIDIDEQAEISRQMISRGWTSAAKLGIMGFSYGGYFTWQSVVRHPDLYAAANAQSALIDLLNEWQSGYPGATAALEGLPPWVAGAEYMRDSPSYNAERGFGGLRFRDPFSGGPRLSYQKHVWGRGMWRQTVKLI